MPQPKITIITPVGYDRHQWLTQCIASTQQLRKNNLIHHLIIYDGKDTQQLPHTNETNLTQLTLPVPRGVSAARNAGLTYTNTPWIFPLDADDELYDNNLAKLYNIATENLSVTWITGMHYYSTTEPYTEWKPTTPTKLYRAGTLASQWKNPDIWHSNNILVRTETALQVGGWAAVGGCEDRIMLLKTSIIANGIATNTPTVLWRQHAKQTTNNPTYAKERKTWIQFATQTVNAYAKEHNMPQLTDTA